MLRSVIMIMLCLGLSLSSFTQGSSTPVRFETAPKPYKLVTSGGNVSIKSTGSSAIKSILVWTAEGKRIVEEKDINATTYNFRVSANARYFFVRIQMKDGKSFSEKIAARAH